MPRILGVDVPNDKPVYVSLTYLYGIGRATAIEICFTLNVDPQIKASTLGEDDIARLNNYLDKELIVEGQLRRQVQQNISRLREIRCYRGVSASTESSGTGTAHKNERRTRKGVKKTVAGKKGVKDMKH